MMQAAILDPILLHELRRFVSSVFHNLFVMNIMWSLSAGRWLPLEGSIHHYLRLRLPFLSALCSSRTPVLWQYLWLSHLALWTWLEDDFWLALNVPNDCLYLLPLGIVVAHPQCRVVNCSVGFLDGYPLEDG